MYLVMHVLFMSSKSTHFLAFLCGRCVNRFIDSGARTNESKTLKLCLSAIDFSKPVDAWTPGISPEQLHRKYAKASVEYLAFFSGSLADIEHGQRTNLGVGCAT